MGVNYTKRIYTEGSRRFIWCAQMQSFKMLQVLVFGMVFSGVTLAHRGENPRDKLTKNQYKIEKMQRQYGKTDSSADRLSELNFKLI